MLQRRALHLFETFGHICAQQISFFRQASPNKTSANAG
jgi:hypothetical protein